MIENPMIIYGQSEWDEACSEIDDIDPDYEHDNPEYFQ